MINFQNSRNIVLECNRFFGTTPTYYIVNGKENNRFASYMVLAKDYDKRNYEKVKRGRYGDLKDVRITCKREHIYLHKSLSLLGKLPRFQPYLDVIPEHGKICVSKRDLELVQTPLLTDWVLQK